MLSKGISNETNIDNNKDIQVSGDSEGGASDDGATSHGGNLPNLYDPCVGDSSGVMHTQTHIFVSTRKRSFEKVMFSQASACSQVLVTR